MEKKLKKLRSFFNRNLINTVLARFFSVASGLLISVITARVLGPSDRGNYFFISSIALTIAQFSNLGMQTSNIYAVTKDKNILPKLESNSFFISFVFTPFIVSVACVFLNSFGVIAHLDVMIVISIIMLASSNVYYLVASNLLVGLDCVNLFNKIHFYSNFFVGLLVVLVVLYDHDYRLALLTCGFGWLCVSIVTSLLIFKQTGIKLWRFDYELFKENFPLSLKVYLSCVVGFFMLKSNVFFVQYFLGSEVVGYYSIASQINDTICILPSTLGFLLYPKLLNSLEDKWKETKDNLLFTSGFMLAICLIACGFAPLAIRLLFGPGFLPSTIILMSMLPGVFFYSLISILSQYLASNGYPRTQLYAWIFALIFSVFSNLALIPRYKSVGAGISLSLTYVFTFIFLSICSIKTRDGVTKEHEQSVVGV